MPQLFSFFSSFFFTFLIDISSRKHRRDGWGEREINIIHYSKLLINCSHESLVSKLFSKLSPIVCAAAHLQRLIKFLIPNQKKKEPTVAWWSAWLKTCVCVCGLPSPRNLITWSVWLLEVKEERGKKMCPSLNCRVHVHVCRLDAQMRSIAAKNGMRCVRARWIGPPSCYKSCDRTQHHHRKKMGKKVHGLDGCRDVGQ